VEGYIALAVRLSGELSNLGQKRRGLRDQLNQSPLCDAKRLARALEEIYRQTCSELRPAGGR
jgi:predicted O-linked N-acetylglucosamine transferase (SPINDLY family)